MRASSFDCRRVLIERSRQIPATRKILERISHDDHSILRVAGLVGLGKDILAGIIAQKEPLAYVVSTEERAEQATENIRFLYPDVTLIRMPAWTSDGSPPIDVLAQRIEALSSLGKSVPDLLITTYQALGTLTADPSSIRNNSMFIAKGMNMDLDSLVCRIGRMGFEQVQRVEAVGEFALRGAILDIFSFGKNKPSRIELWGETIESLRCFDVSSQRSIQEENRVVILPRYEHLLEEEDLHWTREAKKIPSRVRNGIRRFRSSPYFDGYEGVLRQFIPGAHPLIDLLDRKSLVLLEPANPLVDTSALIENAACLEDKLAVFRRIELKEPQTIDPADLCFPMEEILPNRRSSDPLIAAIDCARKRGMTPIVAVNTRARKDAIQRCIDQMEREAEIVVGPLTGGFLSSDMRLAILPDDELHSRTGVKRRDRVFSSDSELAAPVFDLQKGDYVTHIEHGMGRFVGIKRLRIDGGVSDFLDVAYRDDDHLLVPVSQLDRLDRLSPSDDGKIERRLDKLGSKSWERRLQQTRESLRKMTIDLLSLYARRDKARGFAYPCDDSWEQALASSFQWEETPDQARAIAETLRDLCSEKPMDRLICGDVGFGKTEIALRAAFKVVMGGKQVAILVPTTLLAEQHKSTFEERYTGFPIEVRALSRFRSRKEEKEILEGLSSGFIDVVIGTHRILSEDVKFADLGLLIVDEEHRFGVEQKERMKALRLQADSLTMTATPIPRTLQMAVSGIRDLSVISTPPTNRFPVSTTILPFSETRIRSAIRKELDRGGQVFFVHNHIKSLRKMEKLLCALVPEATIGVAHARMPERTLERVMEGFYRGRFDLLLSTMIVESGLDLPNANTIIVNRADRLGLAQLHQLRGRVGRAGTKAYAYLVVPANGIVGLQARRRLRAARDHSRLGSGLELAMRDMEIRGTGNLLGKEQHGFIRSIGIENYSRLLQEITAELQGMDVPNNQEIRVLIEADAYLPDDYVTDPLERFTLYKRISRLGDRTLVEDLIDECQDRFGKPPDQFLNLLKRKKIELTLRNLGAITLKSQKDSIVVTWPSDPQPNPLALARLASALPNRVIFKQAAQFSVVIDTPTGIDSITLLVEAIERAWFSTEST